MDRKARTFVTSILTGHDRVAAARAASRATSYRTARRRIGRLRRSLPRLKRRLGLWAALDFIRDKESVVRRSATDVTGARPIVAARPRGGGR